MRLIFIFLFGHDGEKVYSTYKDGVLWFSASHICNLLDISDVSSAMRGKDFAWFNLDEEDKRKFKDPGINRHSEVWFISESGFWKLLGYSNAPLALRFRAWVATTMLPLVLHQVLDDEIAERGYRRFLQG